MPGWFDIDHLDEEAFKAMMKGHKGFDPEGTNESISYITDLITKEMESGIPADRIVVGGFSQGGHIALRTALQHPVKLAGCAALSTWLEPSPFEIPSANLNLPIFYGHGSADPLIPAPIAAASNQVLEGRGVTNVEFKMYPGMGHSTCQQEMTHLKAFLLKTLPDKAATKEDVENMSARELKMFLQERGESAAGLLEKSELVAKALSLL
jgi:predicted esterase